jgi:hypothetical protein
MDLREVKRMGVGRNSLSFVCSTSGIEPAGYATTLLVG